MERILVFNSENMTSSIGNTAITEDKLYLEISHLIEISKNNALVYVNQTLVLMYRGIGKHIKNHILGNEKAQYGDEVIKKTLSETHSTILKWLRMEKLI